MPFVKLNCNILYSSIWAENAETCKVWITLLAMADCSGMVAATAPGIARIANISLDATAMALQSFESPDEYSKSQDDDGRRIRRVDGGYLILNYDKYRERDNTSYERLKKYREKNKGLRRNQPLSGVSSASVSSSVSDMFLSFWKEYPRKVNKKNAEKAFNKINPDKELFEKIMVALAWQRTSWSDIKFTPHAATWLNGNRWEDEKEIAPRNTNERIRPNEEPTPQQQLMWQLESIDREIMRTTRYLEQFDGTTDDELDAPTIEKIKAARITLDEQNAEFKETQKELESLLTK